METGAVVFSTLFVVLPLLLLGLAMLLPAYALALGITALVFLAVGFTVGISVIPA